MTRARDLPYADLTRDLISEVSIPTLNRGRLHVEVVKLYLREKRALWPGAVLEYAGTGSWSDFVHVVNVGIDDDAEDDVFENHEDLSIGLLATDEIGKALAESLTSRDQAWGFLSNPWFEQITGVGGIVKAFTGSNKSYQEMSFEERQRVRSPCEDCNDLAVAIIKGSIGMDKFIGELLSHFGEEPMIDEIVFSTQLTDRRDLDGNYFSDAYDAISEVTLNGKTFYVFLMPE